MAADNNPIGDYYKAIKRSKGLVKAAFVTVPASLRMLPSY